MSFTVTGEDPDNRKSVQTGHLGVTEEVPRLSQYLTKKNKYLEAVITATDMVTAMTQLRKKTDLNSE